jgi:putative membrane protein
MARSSTRIAAVLGLAALTVAPAAAATAASGQAGDLAARQAVLTAIDPTGAPTSSRVFTQVSGQDGEVSLADAPTGGLRNLNGFGAPRVVDGRLVLAGDGPQRTVADYDADQPVSIEISYELDGEAIDGSDVAGRSGVLTTTIVVTNRTAEPTELTWKDAAGVARTETVDVSVPLVGSMSTVLDSRFVGVDAPGAVVAADGRGSTVVNWSLLLFAPLGNDSATLSWTARVTDAVLPQLTAQVLPVDSSSFASLANAEETYRGASDDTYALTQGAVTIDRNLLRLATGASTLLDGVVRLADGSRQLADGLGDATDGSRRLSDGLGQARAGGGQLADGLGDLSAGATQLSDGLGAARAGGGQLSDGLAQLDAGAARLLDGLGTLKTSLNAGLPTARAGVAQLDAGVDGLIAGIGAVGTPDTLLDGMSRLAAGLVTAKGGADAIATGTNDIAVGISGAVVPGLQQLKGGATQMIAAVDFVAGCSVPTLLDGDATNDTPCGSKDVLTYIAANGDPASAGLAAASLARIGTTASGTTTLLGGLKAVEGGASQLLAGVGSIPADCATAQATAAAETASPLGKPSVLTGLTLVTCGAQQLSAGIGSAGTPGDTLAFGMRRLQGGTSNAAAFDATDPGYNPTCVKGDATKQPCGLLQGLQLVAGGLAALDTGLGDALTAVNAGLGDTTTPGETLLFGMASLAAGAGQAAAGGSDLHDGLVQLDDGGAKLAAGAGKAAAGGSDLLDGLVQLDDGGGALADGLVSAEDGAVQVADGLALARIGGGQVADGAAELQSKGTSVLADEVNEAAAGTNRTLAWLQAADARGRGEALPYPAADGAAASIVYQYELAGVSTDGLGEGSRSVLAIGLLGGAAGLVLLGRRRLGRI